MVENLNEGKEKKRLAPVLHFFLSDTVIQRQADFSFLPSFRHNFKTDSNISGIFSEIHAKFLPQKVPFIKHLYLGSMSFRKINRRRAPLTNISLKHSPHTSNTDGQLEFLHEKSNH